MSVWFQGVFCLSWPNVRLSFAGHAVGTLQILQATSALRQSQRETYTSTGVVFCESVRQALGTELKYFCVLRAMCLELLMSHKPLEACHHHLRIDFIDWMQYSTLIRVLYFVFVFRFCRSVYSNLIHCTVRRANPSAEETLIQKEKNCSRCLKISGRTERFLCIAALAIRASKAVHLSLSIVHPHSCCSFHPPTQPSQTCCTSFEVQAHT